MKLRKDWKKVILLSCLTAFIYVIVLINVFFFLRMDSNPLKSIYEVGIFIIPIGILLGFLLSVESKRKYSIITKSVVYSIIVAIAISVVLEVCAVKSGNSYAIIAAAGITSFILLLVPLLGFIVGHVVKNLDKLNFKKHKYKLIIVAMIILIIIIIDIFISNKLSVDEEKNKSPNKQLIEQAISTHNSNLCLNSTYSEDCFFTYARNTCDKNACEKAGNMIQACYDYIELTCK